MASSWGDSWAQAWGDAWGAITTATSSAPNPQDGPFPELAIYFRTTIHTPTVFFSTRIVDHTGGTTRIKDYLDRDWETGRLVGLALNWLL